MQSFISSEQYYNDFIHINSCGCQHFCGISASSTRPYGRIDYHILYISKGVCHITVYGEDKCYETFVNSVTVNILAIER